MTILWIFFAPPSKNFAAQERDTEECRKDVKKSVDEMKETIKTDKKELKDKVCAISHQVDLQSKIHNFYHLLILGFKIIRLRISASIYKINSKFK